MKYQIFLTILNLAIVSQLYGQIDNDTSYYSSRLTTRFGLDIQKGYGLELGLQLNNFQTRFPRKWTQLPYASSGFYISSEFHLRNSNEIIIGPKVGWELGVIGETHGSFFGAEFINYTDFTKYSPALMLKVGVPMLWLNIGYGYTIFFNDALKSEIGNHRIVISYTINRKANNAYKKLKARIIAERNNKNDR
jgi:hypothetical protein